MSNNLYCIVYLRASLADYRNRNLGAVTAKINGGMYSSCMASHLKGSFYLSYWCQLEYYHMAALRMARVAQKRANAAVIVKMMKACITAILLN